MEHASRRAFKRALRASKSAMRSKGRNPNYWMVDVHSKREYQGMRMYLTPDKKSGVAITKDGNITSLFSNSTEGGRMAKLLTFAVAMGGRKLDCFGGGLQNMYARFGAKAVAQTPFDEQYAPNGWDGRHLPVVAMVLPKSVGAMMRAYDRNRRVDLNKVREYPDYDSMIAARDRSMNRGSNTVAAALRTALGGSN